MCKFVTSGSGNSHGCHYYFAMSYLGVRKQTGKFPYVSALRRWCDVSMFRAYCWENRGLHLDPALETSQWGRGHSQGPTLNHPIPAVHHPHGSQICAISSRQNNGFCSVCWLDSHMHMTIACLSLYVYRNNSFSIMHFKWANGFLSIKSFLKCNRPERG